MITALGTPPISLVSRYRGRRPCGCLSLHSRNCKERIGEKKGKKKYFCGGQRKMGIGRRRQFLSSHILFWTRTEKKCQYERERERKRKRERERYQLQLLGLVRRSTMASTPLRAGTHSVLTVSGENSRMWGKSAS